MNWIALAQPLAAMRFHDAEPTELLSGRFRIVNSAASKDECPPILIFSNDDQQVVCSYVLTGSSVLDRQETKLRVLRNLLKFAGDSQNCDSEIPLAMNGIRITSDKLGKPELYVNGRKGPSVSFTHVSGMTWGALCLTEGIIGVDAARSLEFPTDYPYHRAFHQEELTYARTLTYGNVSHAAALLWTAKESVVKCIGTGFHMIDPLEIRIVAKSSTFEKNDYTACFDDRILRRLPELVDHSIRILALKSKGLVISIAFMIKNGSAQLQDARSCGH